MSIVCCEKGFSNLKNRIGENIKVDAETTAALVPNFLYTKKEIEPIKIIVDRTLTSLSEIELNPKILVVIIVSSYQTGGFSKNASPFKLRGSNKFLSLFSKTIKAFVASSHLDRGEFIFLTTIKRKRTINEITMSSFRYGEENKFFTYFTTNAALL